MTQNNKTISKTTNKTTNKTINENGQEMQCDCNELNSNLNNLKTTVNLLSSQINTVETQVTSNTHQLDRLAQAEAQLNDFVTKGAADLNIDPKHLNSDTT